MSIYIFMSLQIQIWLISLRKLDEEYTLGQGKKIKRPLQLSRLEIMLAWIMSLCGYSNLLVDFQIYFKVEFPGFAAKFNVGHKRKIMNDNKSFRLNI